MLNKQETYALLNENGVKFETYDHAPVYTILEMDALDMPYKDKVVKNLFLRDDKARNFYLVTIPGHKKVDLKDISAQIPSRKLSFANEQWLEEYLALKPGSVTPLGILNNDLRNVTMVFDSELQGQLIGIHPMENTATVFLLFEELLKLVQDHGNPVVILE